VASQGIINVTVEDIERISERSFQYDRKGEQHYDYISAFIKSMRKGDANAALYYLAVMLEGGEDIKFIARRMMIFASEDTSADPKALEVAVTTARAVEQIGMPEAQINLAQGVIYLAEAKKSRRAINAIEAAVEDIRSHGAKPPPGQLVNETSMRAEPQGLGQNAVPQGPGQNTEARSSCMPLGLEDKKYLAEKAEDAKP
jgi:putative ATPase